MAACGAGEMEGSYAVVIVVGGWIYQHWDGVQG